ncbi:hypothetical protein Bbelb_136150 [Branchiostoma belcheri]|nr:hypothetical protein Bbelb_136150 [Branchiostoma belcheri]
MPTLTLQDKQDAVRCGERKPATERLNTRDTEGSAMAFISRSVTADKEPGHTGFTTRHLASLVLVFPRRKSQNHRMIEEGVLPCVPRQCPSCSACAPFRLGSRANKPAAAWGKNVVYGEETTGYKKEPLMEYFTLRAARDPSNHERTSQATTRSLRVAVSHPALVSTKLTTQLSDPVKISGQGTIRHRIAQCRARRGSDLVVSAVLGVSTFQEQPPQYPAFRDMGTGPCRVIIAVQMAARQDAITQGKQTTRDPQQAVVSDHSLCLSVRDARTSR